MENYKNSKLDDFATNGNPIYPNSGRTAILNQTKIGTTKYNFTPYKNPDLVGTEDYIYNVNSTYAKADETSPYKGRGTGDGINMGVFNAINNYNGGTIEDINGVTTVVGSGRNNQIKLNVGTWGYGPKELGGNYYTKPDISQNKGQVII